MSGKILRTFPLSRSSYSRFSPRQVRVRHLVLAAVVLCLYFTLPSFKLPVGIRGRRIQALFPHESGAVRSVRIQRQSKVREAFQHAWKGYREHAWMYDEVMPVSGGHKNGYAGWGATLVDPLDTLWIMGLKDEFEESLKALEQIDFSKPNEGRVPIFEVTIRYLGGLLGAWDVSEHKYPILLEKAKQLGDLLYRAFDTPNGIPVPYYDWEHHGTEKLLGQSGVILAQIGSLSLEFIRLSQTTGDPKYADAIQIITNQLEQTQNKTTLPGMWPSQVNCAGPTISFSSQSYTLGAYAGESILVLFLRY
jgi:mannosyl-oligosaccharide alpha-1,2-mannosidase